MARRPHAKAGTASVAVHKLAGVRSRSGGYPDRECRVHAIAKARGFGLPPRGDSHLPRSCLCIASGLASRAALLLLVACDSLLGVAPCARFSFRSSSEDSRSASPRRAVRAGVARFVGGWTVWRARAPAGSCSRPAPGAQHVCLLLGRQGLVTRKRAALGVERLPDESVAVIRAR